MARKKRHSGGLLASLLKGTRKSNSASAKAARWGAYDKMFKRK